MGLAADLRYIDCFRESLETPTAVQWEIDSHAATRHVCGDCGETLDTYQGWCPNGCADLSTHRS